MATQSGEEDRLRPADFCSGIHLGAGGKQRLDGFGVTVQCGEMDRLKSGLWRRLVRLRARCDEKTDHVGLPLQRGQVDRRHALPVRRIHFGAGSEQPPGHFNPPVLRAKMQGLAAVLGLRIHLGPGGQKHLGRGDVAMGGRDMDKLQALLRGDIRPTAGRKKLLHLQAGVFIRSVHEGEQHLPLDFQQLPLGGSKFFIEFGSPLGGRLRQRRGLGSRRDGSARG